MPSKNEKNHYLYRIYLDEKYYVINYMKYFYLFYVETEYIWENPSFKDD